MVAMKDTVPLVKQVRGRGLMLAVELAGERAQEVVSGCLERGVIVNNVTPTAVRVLPPLVLTEEEAAWGMDVLEGVLSGL